MKHHILFALFISVMTARSAPEPADLPTAPAFRQWAKTPPMGWNSYDNFGGSVTEDEVIANATYMKDKLLAHGWQYVVVDYRWYDPKAIEILPQGNRCDKDGDWLLPADEFGRLLPATNRFPSAAAGKGFKPLADKLHGMGLKFGIHIMRGIPRQSVKANTPIEGSAFRAAEAANTKSTCTWCNDMYGVANNAAGQAWYDSIFRLYASWGVDYVKVDNLTNIRPYPTHEIEMVRKAIDKCGREIVFSTSPGETPIDRGGHVSANANMWRAIGDLWDKWPDVRHAFDLAHKWEPFRGTGNWPDLDMLPLGRLGTRCLYGTRQTRLTHDEQRTLMTLWSIARSPLMFGGDLTHNDAFTDSILTNNEFLAVNQHSTGNRQIYRRGNEIAWVANAPDSKDRYVALFNVGKTPGLVFDAGKATSRSPVVNRQTPGHMVDITADITQAKKLFLVVEDAGDGFMCDHADWIDPKLTGPKGELKLTDLRWSSATAGWGTAAKGKSVSGKVLTLDGKTFTDGIGTHSPSVIMYDLPAGYTNFSARGGLDQGGASQNLPGASVRFAVYLDDASQEGLQMSLADLGITGPCRIRDLWSGRDLGVHHAAFTTAIPPHGAGLFRFIPENQ